jgi:DNA-binding HxlR family transcriptional regulator
MKRQEHARLSNRTSDPQRRSRCPISYSLDLFGDRWSLLIIRDLFLGRVRFREFVASPEHIPTNILSERLQRLLDADVIRQIPAPDGTKRWGYQLTKKGQALRLVLEAMRDWGLAWDKTTKVAMESKQNRPG